MKRIFFLMLCIVFLAGCQNDSKKEMTKEEVMYSELREIGEVYKSIYEKACQEEQLAAIKTKEEIADCLGEAGCIVCDTENEINMRNYEEAEIFCEKAEQGENAEITILLIKDDGGLVRYDLKTTGKEMDVVVSSFYWNEIEIVCNYYEEYTAQEWSYTEKGYLFIEQARPDGYDGPPGQIGFRIQPLDDILRELNETYVKPIGYERNKLLITEWNENDYSELDFEDLYEIMYFLKNGEYLSYEIESIGQQYEISKEAFESVIQSYFPIESSVLQKETSFDSEKQVYHFTIRGIADAEMPYGPYPEVVDYEELENGDIKLIVEAVWARKHLDQAIRSELIVRPMENGKFQYISNQLLPCENSVEPTWYQPRDIEIAIEAFLYNAEQGIEGECMICEELADGGTT